MTPKMNQLRSVAPYWYLATVFTSHVDGHEVAFRQAASVQGFFMRLGIPVFCPIAHGYPPSQLTDLPKDHDFWMNIDQPFMDTAGGMIVVMMEGWEKSEGITYEIEQFELAGKPVLYMEFPPTYGHDPAKMDAYFADQDVDFDDRVIKDPPEPEHFDSAFDTKAEMEAKVAK